MPRKRRDIVIKQQNQYTGELRDHIVKDAYIISEYLAVHNTVAKRAIDSAPTTIPGLWNITHIPTGWGVYGKFKSREDAIDAAMYMRDYPLDFRFTDVKNISEKTKRIAKNIIGAVAGQEPYYVNS